MDLHGTFAQCPNVLICTVTGAVSQRLLGEVYSSIQISLLFLINASLANAELLWYRPACIYLEEFMPPACPQWESRGHEGLSWGSFEVWAPSSFPCFPLSWIITQ